jgi:hypothetical protein
VEVECSESKCVVGGQDIPEFYGLLENYCGGYVLLFSNMAFLLEFLVYYIFCWTEWLGGLFALADLV